MTRTPDETKKGLECCNMPSEDMDCTECPYYEALVCGLELKSDALALIRQLQADNAQQARCIENMTDKLNAMNDEVAKLQAERDAARENIRGDCVYCLHLCEDMVAPSCFDCANKGFYRWEWRGVQKEDGNEAT